jgi:hypothetical protein
MIGSSFWDRIPEDSKLPRRGELPKDLPKDVLEEIKEYFQRLQEGLRLTSSERLNSVHSSLRDFAVKLTKHDFFRRIAASNKRYGHFDIVAKAAAIEIDGLDVGLRYDDLRAVFQSQATFSSTSNVAKRLKAGLDFVNFLRSWRP